MEKVYCKYCEQEIFANTELTHTYHKKCKRLHDETILHLCEPHSKELVKRIKNKLQLYGEYDKERISFIEVSNPSEDKRKELRIELVQGETDQELRKIGSINQRNLNESFLTWLKKNGMQMKS